MTGFLESFKITPLATTVSASKAIAAWKGWAARVDYDAELRMHNEMLRRAETECVVRLACLDRHGAPPLTGTPTHRRR